MINSEFRAWYKGDIKMNEPLMFDLRIKEGEEAVFVHGNDKDSEIIYSVEAVFCDEDWIVEISTIPDSNNDIVFVGDILGSIKDKSLFKWIVCEHGGLIGIKNISLVHLCLEKFFPLEKDMFKDRIIIGNIHENHELLKNEA